jgi:hypothetical protein
MSTLTYRAVAHKGINHICDGVIYLHYFGTGWQELVFSDHAAAKAWALRTHSEYHR